MTNPEHAQEININELLTARATTDPKAAELLAVRVANAAKKRPTKVTRLEDPPPVWLYREPTPVDPVQTFSPETIAKVRAGLFAAEERESTADVTARVRAEGKSARRLDGVPQFMTPAMFSRVSDDLAANGVPRNASAEVTAELFRYIEDQGLPTTDYEMDRLSRRSREANVNGTLPQALSVFTGNVLADGGAPEYLLPSLQQSHALSTAYSAPSQRPDVRDVSAVNSALVGKDSSGLVAQRAPSAPRSPAQTHSQQGPSF